MLFKLEFKFENKFIYILLSDNVYNYVQLRSGHTALYC